MIPRLPAAEIAARIDHTLLDPMATAERIDRLCDEALAWSFATVCVNPVWAERCVLRLRDSSVGVCAVVGFPLGATLREVKALEARRMAEVGAREIDVVAFLGALEAGRFDEARADLEAVVHAAKPAAVKAILETGRLAADTVSRAARMAVEAGASFVKTSTGFGPGATVEDVRRLRDAVGPHFGVKAAGGIRTLDQACALLAAGATRLGTSAGPAIVAGEG